MLYFDKEEFLKRLDIRLSALTSALGYHEKFLASAVLNYDVYIKMEKRIDNACKDFMNYIVETDKQIRDEFAEIRKEMQDMATPNQHKHITILDKESGVKVILYADVFAQSAFDNNVGFDDFKLSMDMFCNRSVSSVPQIYEWRDEATEIFFGLLEKAGKLKFSPTEFLGGSDYEEDNGTAPDIENK